MTANVTNERFETIREPVFWLLLFTGMLVFALGTAFLVLGLSMSTTPPAPYFESRNDKLLVIGLSIAGIVAGIATVRFSGKVVGW